MLQLQTQTSPPQMSYSSGFSSLNIIKRGNTANRISSRQAILTPQGLCLQAEASVVSWPQCSAVIQTQIKKKMLTLLIEKWGTAMPLSITLKSAPHRPCGYLHWVISLAQIFLWVGLGYLCQPVIWKYIPLVPTLNKKSPLLSQVHRLTLDTLLQDAKLPPTTEMEKLGFPPGETINSQCRCHSNYQTNLG